MTARPTDTEICAQARQSILEKIPGSEVQVDGGGGHFTVDVKSSEFGGLNTLKRQQLVYSCIAHLMKGDGAPIHAVDRMITREE